jgi:hypothetical protein
MVAVGAERVIVLRDRIGRPAAGVDSPALWLVKPLVTPST